MVSYLKFLRRFQELLRRNCSMIFEGTDNSSKHNLSPCTNIKYGQYNMRHKAPTLGRPGNSLSTSVDTWNCNILVSSAIMWAAAPFCSFLFNWLLALMISDNLCVKSSWNTRHIYHKFNILFYLKRLLRRLSFCFCPLSVYKLSAYFVKFSTYNKCP